MLFTGCASRVYDSGVVPHIMMIMIVMFSYLHAFAAARSVSTAGRQSKISTHRPEHAAGVLCIGVCACWVGVRERAWSPGMLIDKTIMLLLLSPWKQRDMSVGAMDKVLIYFTQIQCKHLASSVSARQGCSRETTDPWGCVSRACRPGLAMARQGKCDG